MTYQIRGLDPADFRSMFDLDEADLADRRAEKQIASASTGFPCRVSLRDAAEGEELLLVNYTNHEVETPYRASFAIFIRKDASEAAEYIDQCPPVFEGRPIALRGYDADGMLADARLALPGQADQTIRSFLEDDRIAYIHAHNPAHGCFSARIDRHDG